MTHKRQLLVLLVVLYFTFIGGSFYSELTPALRVFNQCVVTAILLGWLVGKLKRGEPFPRTPLDGPVLAWLVANFAAALLGLSPRFSLERTWLTLTHTLAFYLLVDLHSRGWTRTLTRVLYLSAGVVCLVGLAEFASWYFGLPLLPHFVQGWPQIGGLRQPFPPKLVRLNFTLNGATALSGYLALLIPPALAILASARRRDDRQAIAIWLVLAVVVEALSFSRGGILALLVSLPLTGLSWWLAQPSGQETLRGLWRKRKAALIVTAVAILAVTAFVGPTWLRRTFFRTHSVDFRLTLWDVAWKTFLERPLTGAGPYGFGRALLRRNDPALPRAQVMTAHNVYLNTAAELGLVGLAAGGWLLLAAARACLARWRGEPDGVTKLQVAAAGAALVGLAVHSLVDTFTATPNVLPALGLAAFALTAGRPVQRALPARRVSPAAILALVALVIYAAALAWMDVAQFHLARSVSLSARDDLDGAAQAAERAQALDPGLTLYTFQLAYLHGGTERPSALPEAVELYRAGLDAEPVSGIQEVNLAAVLWRSGDRQGAIEAMGHAIATVPDPIYLVNQGTFYEQVGEVDSALGAYARALSLSPDLAGSAFWQADVERAALWPTILSRAENAVPPQEASPWRLRVALAQADWEAIDAYAQAVLERAPGDCLALSALARARFEMGMTDDAGHLAQQALNLDRGCSAAYVVRGRARHSAGEEDAAETDWRTALFLGHREAATYLGRLYQARGDVEEATRNYGLALAPTTLSADVEVTLYSQRVAFDLLPPLFRIGVSAEQAVPWLELAALYEQQGNTDAARLTYRTLLRQDPFVEIARERLDELLQE